MLQFLFVLILAVQVSTAAAPQSLALKKPDQIAIPDREAAQHVTDDDYLFLRTSASSAFFESIAVTTVVDIAGTVVSAQAERKTESEPTPFRVKLTPAMFDQAEALVRALHFKPFERAGRPVAATFTMHVSLLPAERKVKQQVPFPKVKDWKSVKITLERTGCFGTCPSYSIQVLGDGTVLYDGHGYVAFTGQHRGSVPPDSVMELVKLFEQANYFSLDDEYQAGITDCPTYMTSIEFDGRHKRVVDYVGLQIGMPVAVDELERSIDRIAGSDRWTKGNAETLAALEAEHWNFKSRAAAETLARVAGSGDAEVVRDLVLAGAPLNGRAAGSFRYAGSSTLEIAASRGDAAMLRALLAGGAGTDSTSLARAMVLAATSGN